MVSKRVVKFFSTPLRFLPNRSSAVSTGHHHNCCTGRPALMLLILSRARSTIRFVFLFGKPVADLNSRPLYRALTRLFKSIDTYLQVGASKCANTLTIFTQSFALLLPKGNFNLSVPFSKR